MLGKTTYLQAIPQKATKSSKFAITDYKKKPGHLFYCTTQASTLAPAIIFANLGSFAKGSVPVETIIP